MPTKQAAVSLYAGLGLADLGLEQAGFGVVGAVEKSADIAEWHQINHPKCKTMVGSIEEFDYRQFDGIDLLHMSPPCQQYSQARSPNLPRHEGADAGLLALKAIDQTFPRFITLENVRGYLRADSYLQIKRHLWNLGYWLNEEIFDSADYGIPQSRKRLISRWIRSDVLSREEVPISYTAESLFGEKFWSSPFPEKHSTKKGWYSAIADLLPSLPETELAPWQIQRLQKNNHLESLGLLIGDQDGMIRKADKPAFTVCTKGPPRAVLFRRIGQRGKDLDIFLPEEPSPTIKALGHKGQWRQLDGWNGSRVVKITPQALGRFQTVPDSYKLPKSAVLACIGIGNGVPCEMMRQIATSLTNKSENMITPTTDAELTANSGFITVSIPDSTSPEIESMLEHEEIITNSYCLDSEDLLDSTSAEVSTHWHENLTALDPGNSLADIEALKDGVTAQTQMLEALIADYQNQVNDYHNRIKELDEKARAKVLEEFQGLTAQMQVMFQKASSYGVEEEAHEILNSVFPFRRNSSPLGPDPQTTKEESNNPPPIESEEGSPSAQESDSAEQDEHLTMQEIEEQQESSAEQSPSPEAEPSKWTSDDWRTPNEEKQPIVTLVGQALGGAIGLDPTADAQCLLPAQRHFTLADDCLKQTDWASPNGTVFMNPPYSKPLPFLEKLVEQIDMGQVREAIVLLPVRCIANQGTGKIISQRATAHCIWNVGRIAFLGEDGTPKGKPDFDACLIYFGNDPFRFINVFRSHGNVSLLQNSMEPAPESEPEKIWQRCMVKDAQEGQHLCDYKMFRITYFFDVGDPPGLWKVCVIDDEEKYAWYINVEDLAPSPLEFLDDSGTGWKWCFVQAKARIDDLLSSRAKSEAGVQALEAQKRDDEYNKLMKSSPLFQLALDPNQDPPFESPSPAPELSKSRQHLLLTKELKFANATLAGSWETWFSLITGKKLNGETRVLREKKSKLICLENLTAQEVAIVSNFDLSKKPPKGRTEAEAMWTAAESIARYSEMSDEELEPLASEYKKEIFGEDEHPF